MALVKRKNSKNWYVQFNWMGKTFVRSTRTPNPGIARKLEAQWKKECYDRDMLNERPTITLEEAIEFHLSGIKVESTKRTMTSYSNYVLSILDPTLQLQQLTQHEYNKLLQDRKKRGSSAGTLNVMNNAIRGAIRTADEMGYAIPEKIKWSKVDRKKSARLRFLTPEEERRFLAELDPYANRRGIAPYEKQRLKTKIKRHDQYDYAALLLDTGVRCMELAILEWKDVDMENRKIHIWRSKTGTETVLTMTDRAYEIFQERWDSRMSDKWVFTDNTYKNHREYTTSGYRRAFKAAGLEDCSLHTLRHTYASRMAQNGFSLQEIAYLLGHSDTSTAAIYAHLIPQDVTAKAAELLNSINTKMEQRKRDLSKETTRLKLRVV